MSARDRVEERLYRVSEDPKTPPRWAVGLVVAESDWGDYYLPCRNRHHVHPEPYWDVPLNLRRLTHWPHALLSAATGWMLMVEAA